MTPRNCIVAGALVAAVAVALGAFGAHGLHDRLVEAASLEDWRTAVRYQMWHALALVLLGLRRESHSVGRATAWLFVVGVACFSGSIYLLALDVGSGVVWPFTPLGGTLLIAGWIAWLVGELRASPAR